MSMLKTKSSATRVAIFAPKEEGWSESVNINLSTPVEGYKVNEETGEKELTEVDSISFFIGDVIKCLASSDSNVGAFLTAKCREEKLKIIPVLMAGAEVEHTSDHVVKDKKILRELTKITLTAANLERINKALDSLFGF